MVTFDEYEPERFVSFKENKKQRLTFNPKGSMKDGKYGPMVLVSVDGKPAWLGVASRKLTDRLKQIPETSVIEISQSGSGTSTAYEVKVLGKK